MNGLCTQICGGETAGKTTICKRVFQLLHSSGFYPVFLSGKKLKSAGREDFKNRVSLLLSEQYIGFSQRQAKEIDCSKIILIVDDFDQSTLNAKNALGLLSFMKESYHSTIITTSLAYKFAVLEATKEVSILGEFLQAEISEMGHKKRYELTEKWCRLKNVDGLPDDQLRHLIEKKRAVINRVLVSHIVPRTPLIVLILLKATDSGQTSDLAQSGYVRYYKFLIDSALLRSLRLDEAEQAYALLPEIAWAISKTEAKELSADQVDLVIDQFAERRALRKATLD